MKNLASNKNLCLQKYNRNIIIKKNYQNKSEEKKVKLKGCKLKKILSTVIKRNTMGDKL